MISPSCSSDTSPSRTQIAKISAPAVMWFSTSRTVHASQGDGSSSCSGSIWSTTAPVSAMTRSIVAASFMTLQQPVGTPRAGRFSRSFVDGQHLDQFGDRETPGTIALAGGGGRQPLQQQVHGG